MKVCFLGNSHMIAVWQAWQQSCIDDVAATFLGAEGDQLSELTISNGRMHGSERLTKAMLQRTGVTEAIVDEFDAFVIIGLQFTVNLCAPLFATHRIWQGGRDRISNDVFLVSHECLLAATQRLLQQTLAVRLAHMIRTASSAPILIAPQPGLSERVLEVNSEETTRLWRDLHACGREYEVQGIYEKACAEVVDDFEFVKQPTETITHKIFTLREYSVQWKTKRKIKNNGYYRKERRLPTDPTDYFHMNVRYGHIVVSELLDRFSALVV
jgi:hypothetical protein